MLQKVDGTIISSQRPLWKKKILYCIHSIILYHPTPEILDDYQEILKKYIKTNTRKVIQTNQ